MAPPTTTPSLSRLQEAQMNKDLASLVSFARKEFSSLSKGSLTDLLFLCEKALLGDGKVGGVSKTSVVFHMSLALSSHGSQASQAMINAFREAWRVEFPVSVQGRVGEKLTGALKQFKAEKEAKRKPNPRIEPADKTDPLGEFAFSEEREDVPLEPDSSEEKRLYGELSNHFLEGSTAGEHEANLIRSFLVQGLYRDFFCPPELGEILYRGMGVSKKWLETALEGEIPTEYDDSGVDVRCVFKPKPGIGITSWTGDHEIACQFSNTSGKEVEYGVVLHAHAGENRNRFARVPSEDDLEGGLSVSHEHEVIGLGEIKVFRVEWWMF
jgi:hypothetical protein